MPKLNLRTALRIRAASGEVLALKGAGFDWVRPGEPAGPDRNVVSAMSVPLSDTSIATAFQLDGETSGARLAVSTSSDMSSPIYSAPANSTGGTVKHTITGLSPATRYYYAVEVAGTLKTGTQRQCWTAPQKIGFDNFSFAFGSCGSGSGPADRSWVLSGLLELPDPPRMFIHLGDFTYDNPRGTDPAQWESVYNNGLAGTHLGGMARNGGMIYQFDDHDWHINNSAEFISQNVNAAGNPYEVLPQADLVVAGEVHRRRNPVPASFREVATSDGKNNSFAVPHGPFRVIACDTRSRKMWQHTLTFAANYTGATSVQVTAPLANSQDFNRPWPGSELIGQTGVPDGTRIVSWSGAPAGTGTLTYDLVLDQPVTVTSGTVALTKSRTLGSEQLQYVKDQFDAAVANDEDVVLAWPNGLHLSTAWQDNPSPSMIGQLAEIQDLYDYIQSIGWHRRTIVISGDIHSTQVDDGYSVDNGTWGRTRIPVWRVGALESVTNVFATSDYNVYDEQYEPATLQSHAGYIAVSDNGDGMRTYTLTAYHANRSGPSSTTAPLMTHSVTLPQAEIDPFNNGVSIAQTCKFDVFPRLVPISIPLRQQPAPGNLMVIAVSQFPSHAVTGTLAAGWTLRQVFSGSSGVATAVYTKIAGASEPQTISLGQAGAGTGLGVHYIELASDTGWHASLVDATAHDPHTGANRSSVSTTITTTNANCAVVVIQAVNSLTSSVGNAGGYAKIMRSPYGRPRQEIGGANAAAAGAIALSRTTRSSGIQHLCAIAFRKA